MIPAGVTLHQIRPAEIGKDQALKNLTPFECERATRFRFEKDALHWTACRSALRTLLAERLQIAPLDVPLIESTYGKPLLAAPYEELHFNLSHCPDLALLAISEVGPVGIDLEALDRANELLECETSFCHPREIAELPLYPGTRAIQLLEIWTSKEAILKALGTGLSIAPETFFIENQRAVSKTPVAGLDAFTIHRIDHHIPNSYSAALAVETL